MSDYEDIWEQTPDRDFAPHNRLVVAIEDIFIVPLPFQFRIHKIKDTKDFWSQKWQKNKML